jgi:hypothetical protein
MSIVYPLVFIFASAKIRRLKYMKIPTYEPFTAHQINCGSELPTAKSLAQVGCGAKDNFLEGSAQRGEPNRQNGLVVEKSLAQGRRAWLANSQQRIVRAF